MIMKHGHFIIASTLTVACATMVELDDDNANINTVHSQ